MRLSRIEIENFKGIGAAQVIDLKPITLLFGPNSAGKSTVLQALHYLREILERGNADPDETIAGGSVDLGGFMSLVHTHDRERSIRLAVDVALELDPRAMDRLPLHFGIENENERGRRGDAQPYDEFVWHGMKYFWGPERSAEERIDTVSVELEVTWSEEFASPYVSSLWVSFDGKRVAAVHSPPDTGRAMLTDINLDHPVFSISEQAEIEAWDTQHLRHYVASLLREFSVEMQGDAHPDAPLRFSVATRQGALPDVDAPLTLGLAESRGSSGGLLRAPSLSDDPETAAQAPDSIFRRESKILSRIFDEIVLGPVRIVRDCLQQLTYIGPLREVPQRNYVPRKIFDESRWASGLAAWDSLFSPAAHQLLDEVNQWLSREDRLGTGYTLERSEVREIEVPGAFHQLFARGLTEDDLGEIQELYNSLRIRSSVALRDMRNGVLVTPADVGVGISQIIPVVVGCLRDGGGLLAIEQPELHLHPAIQVALGDLFARAVAGSGVRAGKSLLIETHSELLMLRLLRRVRETTDGELPPSALQLDPSDLSVAFVESDAQGARFRTIRVDRHGKFIDRWPHGFFQERADELF